MVTNETKYKNESTSTISDLVGDYCPSLFYSHGTKKEGDLSLLSLFSGCGGMDIGFEGKFICNKKSIPQETDWVEEVVNDNWVLVKKNRLSLLNNPDAALVADINDFWETECNPIFYRHQWAKMIQATFNDNPQLSFVNIEELLSKWK